MNKFVPTLYILSLIACCIEVDISVPSFPALVEHFQTSNSLAQHTVSVNFLGFFLSALIVGPLADCYGRRPVMIAGNGILMVGAFGCVWAGSIEQLLLARFIQGLGAATSAVVVFTIISDSYEGEAATRLIGLMNCALTCLMAAAPVAGSFLNQHFGWHGSYLVVAIITGISWIFLVFGLPETSKNREEFDFDSVFSTVKQMLNNKMFLQTSIAPSLLYATYLCFITTAAFLYMQIYKLSMTAYAIHQAAVVGSFAIVSLFSGAIIGRYGHKKIINMGILLAILGVLGFLFVGICDFNAYLTTLAVSIFAIGFALLYPVIFSKSLEIFPLAKGLATSLIMGMRAVIVALAMGLVGNIYNGTSLSIALVMAPLVLISLKLIFSHKSQRLENAS